MDARIRHSVLGRCRGYTASGLLMLALSFGVGHQTTAQEKPDSLPPSVTTDMITQGSSLFTGMGLCLACHGANAKGVPNLGSDLTDTLWVQTDGSFEQIVARIIKGVPANESPSGVIMPPRGGSSLNEEQVRAVAAYVWNLSRSRETVH